MINPIVFFDSGVGGLPYLVHLRNRYPWENFVYIADSKNFPYGEKSEESLIDIITRTVTGIIKGFNPKVIVVACNTASVTALKQLRESTDIPIVGVVPAIKTASGLTNNNKIGILATNRTVNGSYLQNLIDEFSSDKEVHSVAASDIVTFVEKYFHNTSKQKISEYIREQVIPLKQKGVDSVVLGCTHFIHVAKEIGDALGNHVQIIDSREGVSNQVSRVAILNKDSGIKGQGLFYITKELNDSHNYRSFCLEADLEYKGEIRI